MTDQAKIDAANQKIELARAEFKKAEARFHRIFNAQGKIIDRERVKTPMTLEAALVTYYPDRRENSDGYQFLQDMTYKGIWKGTGFGFNGSAWSSTNQRVLKVTLDHTDSQEKLETLEKIILEIEPLIVVGALGPGKKPHHGGDAELADAKVFDIFDRDLCESRSVHLLLRGDGTWELLNMRHYRAKYSKPEAKGTLMDCLKVIRDRFYYQDAGRDVDGDEDDDY